VTPHLKIYRVVAAWCVLATAGVVVSPQEPTGQQTAKPSEKAMSGVKPAEQSTIPFQIQLLETHIRVEANGNSRKEVHTVIRLINAAGAQQFSRLGFDYNRAFQQVEIPLVRITHANGGTSDVLPSAVTDTPNPAVEKYPAYHDVRVKSVRILGLQEGDMVEYRVSTSTTDVPLAPDFWLEHTFDRSGEVQEEIYELDLPGHLRSTTALQSVWNGTSPVVYMAVPSSSFQNSGEGKAQRSTFHWKITTTSKLASSTMEEGVAVPDVIVSSFNAGTDLAHRIASQLPNWTPEDALESKTRLRGASNGQGSAGNSLQAIYEFVSKSIVTVDLPLGASGFRFRPGKEILESGYATPLDKCYLLVRLAQSAGASAEILLYGTSNPSKQYPRPSAFDHVFAGVTETKRYIALDPSVGVAPFGVLAAKFRGKSAFSLAPHDYGDYLDPWVKLPENLPFHAFQKVGVTAALGEDGRLTAKVKYTLRGDNELLLRMAFHQTPKEKWKEVAGLLALSDGFRGVITGANASDPMETKEPFTVEYELAQDKFVDWARKPVRIPALLPQIGLPDTSGKDAAGNIDLGTPLDVETEETLRLPEGTNVQAPAGTAVHRDYATYSSKYGFTMDTLTAFRHIHFIHRAVAGDRAVDYVAFVQAVQNDQSQYFVLDRGAGVKSTTLR
jgi:hypothetical protein